MFRIRISFLLLAASTFCVYADENQLVVDNEELVIPSEIEVTQSSSSGTETADFSNIKLDGILNKASKALTDLNGPNDSYNLDLGQVTLNYLDVDIVAVSGMRLQLARSYTSGYYPSKPFYDSREGRSSTDQFWQFHAGYVAAPKVGQRNKKYNPFYVAADGSVIELIADPKNKSSYTTKEGWKVLRDTGGRFALISPAGIQYEFNNKVDTRVNDIGNSYPINRFYLTKKSDPYGNSISYHYWQNFLESITTSDNKSLTISWHQPFRTDWLSHKNKARVPSQVSFNGKTIASYTFTRATDNIHGKMYRALLTDVNYADGRNFKYEYTGVDIKKHGNHCPRSSALALHKVTNPDGSSIEYNYTKDQERFSIDACIVPFRLSSKTTRDSNGNSYQWLIKANRIIDDGGGERYLVREVDGPDFTSEYYFSFRSHDGEVWRNGSLIKKNIYSGHAATVSALLQVENFTWEKHIVSTQHEMVNPWYKHRQADPFTAAARIKQYEVIRDGNRYSTSYSDYDEYGNPAKIVESHNDLVRTLDMTYEINEQYHLTHLQKTIAINNKPYASYQYNDHGKLIEQTILGVTSTSTYDELGQLASETNALGQTTTYADYNSGIAQKTIDPQGVVTTKVVNGDGTIASTTDGLGNTTSFIYDDFQRVIEATPPVGVKSTTAYGATLTTTTTHGGNETYTVSNYAGNVLQTEQRQTNEIIYSKSTYDAYGREVFKSYAHYAGNDATLGIYTSYDSLGRVTSECAPKASQYCTQYEYLANDTKKVIRPNGATTSQKFWSISSPEEAKPLLITEPEGISTEMAYDYLGRTIQISQGDLSRSFTYDSHGYLATEQHPEFGGIVYQRDLIGNVLNKTYQGSGKSISYTYDNNNQLLTKTTSESTAEYEYDNNGNVIKLANTYADNSEATSVWRYSYDADNQLHSESIQAGILAETAWTYHYDDLRNLNVIDYPESESASYAPDAFGRPTQLSGFLNKFIYMSSGQLGSLDYSTGKQLAISYDERNLPVTLSSPVSNINYQYDEVGNTTAIFDQLHPEYSLALAYDQQDRLVTANGPWGAGSFAYDANNNLIKQQFGDNIKTYQFNDGRVSKISMQDGKTNSDITPSYDLQANITSRGLKAHESLNFDAQNQLDHYQDVTNDIKYYYDGNGNLLLTTKNGESQITVHNKSGKLIYERNLAADKTTTYYYLDDRLVASKDQDAETTLYYWDITGNVIAATDTDGASLWQKFYYPFGEEFTKTETTSTKLGFSTKEFDSDTGISYFGARHYDPVLSRFLSIDPADVSVDNTMSFNRYIYANNNPYKYRDPDGREAAPVSQSINYEITDKQRELASARDRAGFWQSRQQDSHDPMGKIGLSAVNNDGGVIDYLFGGQAINNRLKAYSKVYGNGDLDLNKVGVKLMNAHVKSVDLDDRGISGLLSPRQIATYHHKVFEKYNLPPTTFGGTPFTGNLIEANITRNFWCRGCDTQ